MQLGYQHLVLEMEMEGQSNQHNLLIGEIGLLGRGSVGDGVGMFFSCESQIATALLLF